MQSKKGQCTHCNKVFRRASSVYEHIRNVHKVQPAMKCDILCPLCESFHFNNSSLRDHLASKHNKVVQKEEYIFFNKADFFTWKETIERNENVFFVTKTSKYLSSGSKKIYYACHRSGRHLSKATGLREVRGSLKTGRHCPAYIEATDNESEIKVLYYKTHLGHEVEIEQDIAELAISHTEEVVSEEVETSKAINELLELTLAGQEENQAKRPRPSKGFKKIRKRDNKPSRCPCCFRLYHSEYYLKLHMIGKHETNCADFNNSKDHIKCGFDGHCTSEFSKLIFYRQHLMATHNVRLEKISKVFDSIDEFYKWKCDEEQDYEIQFISPPNESFVNKKGDIKKRTFLCCCTPKTSDNNADEKYTLKFGSLCPAKIDLYFHNNKYIISYFKTHVGHDCLEKSSLVVSELQQHAEKEWNNKMEDHSNVEAAPSLSDQQKVHGNNCFKKVYESKKLELKEKLDEFIENLVTDKYELRLILRAIDEFNDIFKSGMESDYETNNLKKLVEQQLYKVINGILTPVSIMDCGIVSQSVQSAPRTYVMSGNTLIPVSNTASQSSSIVTIPVPSSEQPLFVTEAAIPHDSSILTPISSSNSQQVYLLSNNVLTPVHQSTPASPLKALNVNEKLLANPALYENKSKLCAINTVENLQASVPQVTDNSELSSNDFNSQLAISNITSLPVTVGDSIMPSAVANKLTNSTAVPITCDKNIFVQTQYLGSQLALPSKENNVIVLSSSEKLPLPRLKLDKQIKAGKVKEKPKKKCEKRKAQKKEINVQLKKTMKKEVITPPASKPVTVTHPTIVKVVVPSSSQVVRNQPVLSTKALVTTKRLSIADISKVVSKLISQERKNKNLSTAKASLIYNAKKEDKFRFSESIAIRESSDSEMSSESD